MVWPGELAGNQTSTWHWKVERVEKSGSVKETRNDVSDKYKAQSAADSAYFEDAI